jgi:murein DD-endopeptidase MepM/ murein hydrolase activator NlpD
MNPHLIGGDFLFKCIFINKKHMGQKLVISESDKEHIRKLHKLKESKELDVFPIDGGFNIGYDKDWSNFSNPRSTANSDFSKKSTHAGAGGHPKGHFGIDIFGNRGTPIVAPVGGVVKLNFSNGNTVIIQDKDGYSHWLGHLDSISVKNGELVNSGTKVGTLGNTGNAKSTAPHLHYNVYPTSRGFYAGEDPIDDLKDAIGKGPGSSNGDDNVFDLTSLDDKIIGGLKSLHDKIKGGGNDAASLVKPKINYKKASDVILSILKNKGAEIIKGLKNLFM